MKPAALRILLVEDSPSDADVLQETLHRSGAGPFEITLAETLKDALAHLGARPFDVLLLDLSLPDSAGPDTFRTARHAAPSLPIVVLTGLDDERLGLQAVREGIQDYLTKGQVDSRKIARAIRYAIERSQAEGELHQLNAELRAANASLINARTAAINLMDDALSARQEAEQAAAALQDSERRMQQALAASHSFAFEWLPATDLVRRSGSCESILGLSGDEITADTGERCFRRIHPDDRTRFVQLLRDLTPAAPNYTTEYRLVSGDGRVVVLEETGQASFDAAGKLQQLVGVSTDITARKQAEEALRRSEDRYRTLFETAPDAIVIHREGRILQANSAALRLLGADSLAQVAAREVLDFFRPETRRLAAERTRAAMAGHQLPPREAGLLRLDGREITVEFHTAPADPTGAIQTIIRDVTERKRAEEALRESEQRLRRAQEIAHLGSWELDLGKNALSWSDEVYRIFGVEPREFGASYEAFLERVHPDDRAAVGAAYSDSVQTGKPGYEIEHRVIRKSTGEVRWVHERCEHIRDAGGTIVRSVGMVHDITERKLAEAALRQSEERYRSLFNTLLEGFCIIEVLFDADHRPIDFVYLEINPAFAAQSGLANAQGRRIRELAPEIEAHWFEIFGNVALTGKPVRFENESKALNRWFDATAYRVGGPDSRKVAVLFNDVTERKRAEMVTVALAQRLEALMQAVPVGVSFSDDATCQRITGNPAVLAQFAVAATDNLSASAPDASAPGRKVRFFREGQLITDADLPLQRAVAENRVIPPMELEIELPDGRRWFADASGAPLRDPQGNVTAGLAVTVDVTARKQAEERLKAALHEKEVLLKEVHHRVKNNLQVIASLVNLQSGNLVDPSLRAMFLDVQNRVRSMALVHETLYQSENLAEVQFADYARGLLAHLWRAHGGGERIQLQFDLEPVALPMEKAVPCGLILNELAGNALKHAFPGQTGGTVTVALHATPDGRVSLGVRDDGVGLPAGFDWRQARSLGLRLVQMLTAQLQGEARVHSSEKGTEIEIALASPAGSRAADGPVPKPETAG